MQTISLNTLPRYLPLIEAANESRFSKLPTSMLLQFFKTSQLDLAHASTEKAHIVRDKKLIAEQAGNVVNLAKYQDKHKPKDFNQNLDKYRKFMEESDSQTQGVITLTATNESADISERVRNYLGRFESFMEKMETELSYKSLGELYLRDNVTFKLAKEIFKKENEALLNEGEQWLKLIQDKLSGYTGRKQKSQENRRNLQDKVLQALNILRLQVQLTEALFTQISTYKTHAIATGVFHTKMVKFSDDIRAIYITPGADFASLKQTHTGYLEKYQDFIKEANATRAKSKEIQNSMPEIPTQKAIGIHLETIYMNDPKIEAETKKRSEDIISRIVKVYQDSRNELVAAQEKVDTHESLLRHRIDRLLNGIDWQDFSRVTWKRSVLNWTKYSGITNLIN